MSPNSKIINIQKLVILIGFALFHLLLSCKKELKTDYKNTRDVEFARFSMPLPGVYMEISLDDLIDTWMNSDLPETIVDKKIKQLEALRFREGSFVIFIDTTDLYNTVLIFKAPNIAISKWTSKELFLVLDKHLREDARVLGIGIKPLENSYYTLSNQTEILKVKFEWDNDSVKSFGTEYLVNLKGASFGIVVYDDEDDFEGLIRKARLM